MLPSLPTPSLPLNLIGQIKHALKCLHLGYIVGEKLYSALKKWEAALGRYVSGGFYLIQILMPAKPAIKCPKLQASLDQQLKII